MVHGKTIHFETLTPITARSISCIGPYCFGCEVFVGLSFKSCLHRNLLLMRSITLNRKNLLATDAFDHVDYVVCILVPNVE